VSGHDLVVGGSVLARLAMSAAGIVPLPLDYRDADALEAGLLQARRDVTPWLARP
jgi:hypothetical protein